MGERELTRSERAAIRKLVVNLCANYDDQAKICLPLDCPCYMLNKWWTGALCRYFANAVLPVDPALESALTGNDTSQRQKRCPVCGKPISQPPAKPTAPMPAAHGHGGMQIKSANAGHGKIGGKASAVLLSGALCYKAFQPLFQWG